jgi:hypothetical protein
MGGIRYAPARDAAVFLCELAAQVAPTLDLTTEFPDPEEGKIRFYILTDVGPRTAVLEEAMVLDEVQRAGDPSELSPLTVLFIGCRHLLDRLNEMLQAHGG